MRVISQNHSTIRINGNVNRVLNIGNMGYGEKQGVVSANLQLEGKTKMRSCLNLNNFSLCFLFLTNKPRRVGLYHLLERGLFSVVCKSLPQPWGVTMPPALSIAVRLVEKEENF